jgi:N,N'-diacetylchitobiose transport system substrate-binding protein
MRFQGRTTAALAALALTAAACGNGGNGDDGEAADGDAQAGGELTVWIMQPGNDEVEDIVSQAVADFEDANDGVTVNLDFVPWANAHDQFVTAIGGGQTPDVAEMGTTWTPEFAELGGLAEVDVDADGDYVESLVESATVDGGTYGYPWYAGARALIYRTDVFEELDLDVPETWDDLIAAGEVIEAETDLDPIHVAGDYNHMIAPMVWQAGGEIAVEDGDAWDPQVDSAEGREAFGMYADLFERGWSPDGAISWNSVDVRDAFTNGESAMMVGGGWDLAPVLADNPELEGSVGSALLPEGPGGSRDTFAGGSHLVSFAEADQELAASFIEFMLEPDQVTTFTEAVGFLPGTVSGIEASDADGDELYGAFTTQMIEHSRSYPPSGAWGEIEGNAVFTNAIQRVLQGELSVDEAVAEVDAEMDAVFSG